MHLSRKAAKAAADGPASFAILTEQNNPASLPHQWITVNQAFTILPLVGLGSLVPFSRGGERWLRFHPPRGTSWVCKLENERPGGVEFQPG